MKILFLILKIWFIGLIIILPIALSMCKSAKIGDAGNRLIDSEK